MHGLTGGSWKRHTDRTRATEMKDTRGNLAVTSGSETYRRCALPRQLSTLLPRCNRHRPILAAPHKQQLDDAVVINAGRIGRRILREAQLRLRQMYANTSKGASVVEPIVRALVLIAVRSG